MPAETIAAVNRTGASQREQHATMIFMDQAGDWHASLVADRVIAVAIDLLKLLLGGQHLQKQWIPGIALFNQGGKVPGYPGCKLMFAGSIGRQLVKPAKCEQFINIVERLGNSNFPVSVFLRPQALRNTH